MNPALDLNLPLVFLALLMERGVRRAGRWLFDNRHACWRRLVAALAAMLIALAAHAESPCHSSIRRDVEKWVPIEVISNKPFVQVRINGSTPERFMLDTGSGAALIDPPLAKSLGFQPVSENQGFFGVGSTKSSLTLLKPTACQEMAGATAEVHLLSFDLSTISSVEGVPVAGTVGGEFLNQHVVVIDYAHARLQVLYHPFDDRGDGVVLPVTIDRQIFVTASIRKASGEVVEGKFYLDTGTRTAVSLNSPFVKNNHLLDGETAIPLATLGVGMGGESLASVYRIREMRVGPIQFRDVVATASMDEKGVFADPKVAGIIGGDLLRRFILILDYAHHRVILEKTPQSDFLFGYDASGLFLIAETASLDRIKILRVVPGSPAEQAGLRKDDVLLSIDGHRARNLEEVRRRFRLVGRTYHLKIARENKTMSMSLRTVDLLSSPTAAHRM